MLRGNCLTWTFILVTTLATLSCRKSDNDAAKSVPAVVSPSQAPPTQPVWVPNPSLVSRLTKTETLGKYQISLPKEFVNVPTNRKVPDTLKLYSWKSLHASGNISAALSVMVSSDAKQVADAKKNMRQVLVNVSAGMTDAMGVSIGRREKTETGLLNEFAFSRFKWSGTTIDGGPVSGLIYGALDGESSIVINAMAVGEDARTQGPMLESIVATFKKR